MREEAGVCCGATRMLRPLHARAQCVFPPDRSAACGRTQRRAQARTCCRGGRPRSHCASPGRRSSAGRLAVAGTPRGGRRAAVARRTVTWARQADLPCRAAPCSVALCLALGGPLSSSPLARGSRRPCRRPAASAACTQRSSLIESPSIARRGSQTRTEKPAKKATTTKTDQESWSKTQARTSPARCGRAPRPRGSSARSCQPS